ncbi:MAG: hypothetical protein MUC43_12380 [Pirellula sp.]|jgi:tetratricopeptide (TPR) repeat protein|nr:hypothetical protein [Pirellula sp.]
MIIIWGSRPYFRKNKAYQKGFCANCGRFAGFSSYDAITFFYLYYIPLIPLSKRKRFHKMCSLCSVAQELDLESFEGIIQNLKANSAEAVLALSDGEKTFLLEGDDSEPIDAATYLLGAADWLYASGNKDFCVSIVGQLAEGSGRFTQSMLLAYMRTMDGKLQEAIDHYNTATQIDNTRYEPYQYKGTLEAETKQLEAAIASYQQVMKKTTDGSVQLTIGLNLVEFQKQCKQFVEASATYDRLLELHPPLANDKSFMKGVAKVKKKAGLA